MRIVLKLPLRCLYNREEGQGESVGENSVAVVIAIVAEELIALNDCAGL